MECETVISKYLERSETFRIPVLLRFHTLFCPECRDEIEKLRAEFEKLKAYPPHEIPVDITENVMARVQLLEETYEHEISCFKWIAVGIVIIGSRFLFTYSDSHVWLQGHFGKQFDIPLNIILGLIVTAYAILFVGTHIDDIKKYIPYLTEKFHL